MKPNRQQDGIDLEFEPYHRKWCGWMGYHPFNNQVGGARNTTKREMTLRQEAQNRKNKELKKKLKK